MRAVHSELETLRARDRSGRPTPAPTTQHHQLHQLSLITSDLPAGHAGARLPISTSLIPTLRSPQKDRPFQPQAAGTRTQGEGEGPLIHTPRNFPGPLHHQRHNLPSLKAPRLGEVQSSREKTPPGNRAAGKSNSFLN